MTILSIQERLEIVKISKEFTKGILGNEDIEGTSWVVADPLSAYLSSVGYENMLGQIPHPETKEPVLIMTFPDGSRFIPAGKDLISIYEHAENFMWVSE